ncbi:MAG: hypothetical protein RL196_1059 [Actinomycetota bacterium]
MTYSIRLLSTSHEIRLGSDFFRAVWGGSDDVVPVDIAIASGHAGGYFSAAFDAHGNMVAACYGFVGDYRGERTLHSHVTASKVSGVGFAIKQHQRAWAIERGFKAITWTFDPLVRRNCVFNLEKLGATTTEYLVNFYGEMHDSINFGDQSDRLFAYWSLHIRNAGEVPTSHVIETNHDRVNALVTALTIDDSNGPMISPEWHSFVDTKTPFALYLPPDIQQIRLVDAGQAVRWRQAVRQILVESLAYGAHVSRMTANREALLVEWPEIGEK